MLACPENHLSTIAAVLRGIREGCCPRLPEGRGARSDGRKVGEGQRERVRRMIEDEKHVENGILHELDDEHMAKLAEKAQGEIEEIYLKYGMPFLFSISILRQFEPQPDDSKAEDAEVLGNLYGCAHCAPYFLAQAAVINVHVAKLLADT